MSHLQIFTEDDPAAPIAEFSDGIAIAAALTEIGVQFDRWPTHDLPEESDGESIMAAYAPEIERLKRERGYRTVDVIRLLPDHPERETLRGKFLSEHTHGEEEVRFFVEGEGLFTLHRDGRVYNLLCTRGDLIGVPAGMRHWFDMGPHPRFTALRLFVNPDGWVAAFTGDDIAARFPRHEPVPA